MDMLRENSRKRYQSAYKIFMSWCSSKQFEELTEDAIFTYFEELSQTYSSTTLWSLYSMLRSMLFIHHNINMEGHTKLKAFLKAKSRGYKAKKYKVFTQEEVNKFITEAPDETYLASKVVIIFLLMGGCTATMIHSLTVDQCEDLGTALLVTIPPLQKSNVPRQFIISGQYYQYCKKYMDLRPPLVSSQAFFLSYQKGQCSQQNFGINKMKAIGTKVAKFLKIDASMSSMYKTSFSFRRD